MTRVRSGPEGDDGADGWATESDDGSMTSLVQSLPLPMSLRAITDWDVHSGDADDEHSVGSASVLGGGLGGGTSVNSTATAGLLSLWGGGGGEDFNEYSAASLFSSGRFRASLLPAEAAARGVGVAGAGGVGGSGSVGGMHARRSPSPSRKGQQSKRGGGGVPKRSAAVIVTH